jgi:hypothetical protein
VHWAGVSLPVSLTSYSVVSITHHYSIRSLPLKASRLDILIWLFPAVLSSTFAIHTCKRRPFEEEDRQFSFNIECAESSRGPSVCLSAQIGAAAFMGGATRMTLTTTVMVMETTGALQLIVPLMITVFVAKVSAPSLMHKQMLPLLR